MIAEIDVLEPAAAQRGGALVLDVREQSEYVNGHVPGAKLVPLGSPPARIGELPRHQPIDVIWASGNRSRTAAAYHARGWRSAQ